MGNRGNVYVMDKWREGCGVYLYTHWGGTDMPELVRNALARKERWNDSSYLARIIFDKMTGLDGGTTGYGISATIGDNGAPIIVLDCKNERVGRAGDPKDGVQPMPDEWYPFDTIVEWTDEEVQERLGRH